MKKTRIRVPKNGVSRPAINGVAQRSLGLLFAAALALSASSVMASDGVALSTNQQQTVLNEAGQMYASAVGLAETDSADAKQLFQTAAGKYQLLVDSGIQNSELYKNLGNAYLQAENLDVRSPTTSEPKYSIRAIVNYSRICNSQTRVWKASLPLPGKSPRPHWNR